MLAIARRRVAVTVRRVPRRKLCTNVKPRNDAAQDHAREIGARSGNIHEPPVQGQYYNASDLKMSHAPAMVIGPRATLAILFSMMSFIAYTKIRDEDEEDIFFT